MSTSPPFVGMISCGDGLLDVRDKKGHMSYKVCLSVGLSIYWPIHFSYIVSVMSRVKIYLYAGLAI